jgi:hypothetical protein
LWVRHEATLKCRGTGIGGFRGREPKPDELWISDVPLASGSGAVALHAPPDELSCWDWPPGQP